MVMQKIIEILVNNTGEGGLCRISQKEIAKQVDRSAACISKTLNRLEKYDRCIEKVAPGLYKLNEQDLINHGPIARIFQYCNIIENHPEIPYVEQLKSINMNLVLIETA